LVNESRDQGVHFDCFRRTRSLLVLIFLAVLIIPQISNAGGVTIITHGFEESAGLPAWIDVMARSIPNYPLPDYHLFPGTNFTIYKVTTTYSNGLYNFTSKRIAGGSPLNTDSGEIIIELDWSTISGVVDNDYASTAEVGPAMAEVLTGTNFIPELNGHSLFELPIHLIGHSRGGSLMSQVSASLGSTGIWVDHLTTLDPYPLNNDGNDDPPATVVDASVKSYANVLFADNYWQNLGAGYLFGDPVGESISGAFNRRLSNLSGGYNNVGSFSTYHSNVHLWYFGTVGLQTPLSDKSASITSVERTNWWVSDEDYESYDGLVAGFFYSLIAGGDRLSTNQPLGVGHPAIKDGYNQYYGDIGAGASQNRAALPTNSGTWPNVITFDVIGTNVVNVGQPFSAQLFYQYGGAAPQVTCEIYLDQDHNPFNSNSVQIASFLAPNTTTNSINAYTNLSLSASNVAPGAYSVFAKISDGSHTRYLYAPEVVQVIAGPDITSPMISIASPAQDALFTNAVAAVTGFASDNIAVASVWYSLNGAQPSQADGTIIWSTPDVALNAGTNTVSVYAVDTSGNFSATNSVSLIYLTNLVVTVTLDGPGKVTPNYNGQSLVFAKKYTMTAKPVKGCKFVGWSGSMTSALPKLTFTMVPSLSFTASFKDITRPVIAVLHPKAQQSITNAVVSATGKSSDNVAVAAVYYQFNSGAWTLANGTTNWSATNLALLSGTNVIRAYAQDTSGNNSRTNSITFKH
jgi:hypothetical protein